MFRAAPLAHLAENRPRKHVARRRLHPLGVVAVHEPLAPGIQQLDAGLRHQPAAGAGAPHLRRPGKRGGGELHEFQVGQHRPGLQREVIAAAVRQVVVAGDWKDPSHAAAGQQHRPRLDRKPAVGTMAEQPRRRPLGVLQHFDGGGMADKPYPRLGRAFDKRRHQPDRPPALAADRARAGMSGGGVKGKVAVLPVEGHAERLELADRGPGLGHEGPGNIVKGKAAGRPADVLQMQFGRILGVHARHRRKAAARKPAVGGLADLTLGDQGHGRAGFACGNGGKQPCKARAHHHDVGACTRRFGYHHVFLPDLWPASPPALGCRA